MCPSVRARGWRVHLLERLGHHVLRRHRHVAVVARAILVLEVQRGAEAVQPAARHDRDRISERVGLLHRVRRQHDHAPLLRLLDDVPHAAPVDRVHPRRRLVEIDHLRVGDERASDRESAVRVRQG